MKSSSYYELRGPLKRKITEAEYFEEDETDSEPEEEQEEKDDFPEVETRDAETQSDFEPANPRVLEVKKTVADKATQTQPVLRPSTSGALNLTKGSLKNDVIIEQIKPSAALVKKPRFTVKNVEGITTVQTPQRMEMLKMVFSLWDELTAPF